MPVEQRSSHPYHMYDAIQAQPDAFAGTVVHSEPLVEGIAAQVLNCRRVYITGIGTSYHAAQAGEFFIRTYSQGLQAQAVHAFDFALYGPEPAQDDAVIAISHRGNKMYTIEALKRARAAGCYTVLITGSGGAAKTGSDFAAAHIETVAQDPSSAHTISYTASLAALALLAEKTGNRRSNAAVLPPGYLSDTLPAAMRAGLAQEERAREMATRWVDARRIWLVGGGPNAITASEIALKIKETSYLQAEGMGVEAMLHGPFQCSEPDDLFVLIAPAGKAQSRVFELAQQIQAIGAAYILVSDGSADAVRGAAAGSFELPAVEEPFTTVSCLIPLQLFAYYLALARGTDPDRFRLDDPRFEHARSLITL